MAISKVKGIYGPFYRLQDISQNELMESSSMVGGKPARNIYAGLHPEVKAFIGSLPNNRSGIEFYTDVEPNHYNRYNAVGEIAYWTEGYPGVVIINSAEEIVGIPAKIVKRVD